MKKSLVPVLLGAVILLWATCKNPDTGLITPQPPPEGGIPGIGEDHTGDPGGGAGGVGTFNFTPFRPQPGAPGGEGSSQFTNIRDVAFVQFFPEIGSAILIMDDAGVRIFDSFGREVMLWAGIAGDAVNDFINFGELFMVLNDNATSSVYTINHFVVTYSHQQTCDLQTGQDWWNHENLGSGSDGFILNIEGPPLDPASGGLHIGLGFEWDIYGNLFFRGTATARNPGDCTSVPPCDRGCPTIQYFIRGIGGPNCSNTTCGTINNDMDPPWGPRDLHIVDTSVFPLRDLRCTPDFDFDSNNRMVLTDFCADAIFITKPIPDFLGYLTRNVPPRPIEISMMRGRLGANSGLINDHLRFPWGVAVDRTDGSNTIYVADNINNRVVVFDPSGDFKSVIVEGDVSVNRGVTTTTFAGPVEVFVDPYGRIFIVDRGTDPQVGGFVEDLYIVFKELPVNVAPGSIQGTVTDSDTGKPVPGATVILQDWNRNLIATTDTEGRYAFDGVIPGRRSIAASKQNYFSTTKEFDITPGEILTLNLSITPKTRLRTGSVSGRVIDRESGLPINGAFVIIRETGQRDFTSGGGFFFIPAVPPGTHTLDVSAEGYESESRTFTVVSGVNTDVGDIKLTPRPPP